MVQWAGEDGKQEQHSKGYAEIKSPYLFTLTQCGLEQPGLMCCFVCSVSITEGELGQMIRSCEQDRWRAEVGRGCKPFWEQEMNRISAWLALSPITWHYFGCVRGTAKSTASSDPFRNCLSLPGIATAWQWQELWLGAMGESALWLFSSSIVILTIDMWRKTQWFSSCCLFLLLCPVHMRKFSSNNGAYITGINSLRAEITNGEIQVSYRSRKTAIAGSTKLKTWVYFSAPLWSRCKCNLTLLGMPQKMGDEAANR